MDDVTGQRGRHIKKLNTVTIWEYIISQFCCKECVCVCVQPWTKGLPPPLLPLYMGRGARPVTSNLAQRSWDVTGEAPEDALVCTCHNFCTSCPISFFVSMVVHDTSPKPFSFQPLAAATRFLQPFNAVARVLLQMTTFNVETPTSLSDSPPCRSITFFLIGEIEL